MQSVTLTRTIDAQPAAVTDAMDDLEPFMLAAGFDEVVVDGDELRVSNLVGIAEIELTLGLLDRPDAALAYEQREGIFEEMVTSYAVEERASGTEVTATTEFALDVALVGGVLDATVIKRQRRKELAAQLDWLEDDSGDSDV
jgi:carbon monoxide dehydrogenase subunit G